MQGNTISPISHLPSPISLYGAAYSKSHCHHRINLQPRHSDQALNASDAILTITSTSTLSASEPTLTLNGYDPTLILIAGPHKTACSTVQTLLIDFRHHLMKDGVLLCDGFHGKYRPHGFKAGASLAFDLQKTLIDKNASVLQSCLNRKEFSSVIVASEELYSLKVDSEEKDQEAGVKFLLSAKPKLQVIVMLRDFPDLVLSLYRELRPHLKNISFPDYIKSFQIRWIELNPYHVARRYQNAGIPVITVKYLDFDFSFCNAINSTGSCDALTIKKTRDRSTQ